MDRFDTGQAREKINQKVDELLHGEPGEALTRLLDRLASTIRARPAAALLVALGLGFVVGRIVRRGG